MKTVQFRGTKVLRRDQLEVILTRRVQSLDDQDRRREKSFQCPRKEDRCESKEVLFRMKQTLVEMNQVLFQTNQDRFQMNQVRSQRKKIVRLVKIGRFARKKFTVGQSQARRLRKEVSVARTGTRSEP